MKKKKAFPETLYAERVDQGGDEPAIFPASVNAIDFSEKDRVVELGEYKLVRKVKVRQTVSVEDAK